jgi:hypothetical protein
MPRFTQVCFLLACCAATSGAFSLQNPNPVFPLGFLERFDQETIKTLATKKPLLF